MMSKGRIASLAAAAVLLMSQLAWAHPGHPGHDLPGVEAGRVVGVGLMVLAAAGGVAGGVMFTLRCMKSTRRKTNH